jgi:hypothetical protein
MNKLSLHLSIFCLLSLVACQAIPSVPRVVINPSTSQLKPNETIVLTAQLVVPEAFVLPEPVEFSWSTTGGRLSANQGKSVSFTAPDSSGKFLVTVSSNAQVLAGQTVIKVLEPIISTFSAAEASVRARSIAANKPQLFELKVQASPNAPLVLLELVTSAKANLRLFTAEGEAIAQSDNSQFFSRLGFGPLALDTHANAEQKLDAQVIDTFRLCRGPCILVKKETEFLLEVETSEEAIFDLYAYTVAYEDDTEKVSESCIDSSSGFSQQDIKVKPKYEYLAALETLDDRDCFETNDPVSFVSLESLTTTTIKVRADIYTNGGHLLQSLRVGTAEDLSSVTLSPAVPVRIIVRSANNSAATASHSRYKLVF